MVLVLEGLPASGKTALANLLSDYYGYTKVNESLGCLGGASATEDQAAIFSDTVLKYSSARRESRAVIDRGYPSLLAWDYCAQKLGSARNLNEKEQWVRMALQNGDLYEPDYYIYLKISVAVSLARRLRPTVVEDVWSGSIGMLHCAEYYEDFFKRTRGKHKTLIVDARQPLEISLGTLRAEGLID